MARTATQEAFAMVGETCPAVDCALDIAAGEIKKQTGTLRDALIDALSRALEAEARIEELEEELEKLREEAV